jgi:hypothetical protein
MNAEFSLAARAVILALGLLIPMTAAPCAAGGAADAPVPELKGRFAAVAVPDPHAGMAAFDAYWREISAIVAASDPIADAALDTKRGGVAPLLLVWGYWDTPEMPGLKCEASDAARHGKNLWGFGEPLQPSLKGTPLRSG